MRRKRSTVCPTCADEPRLRSAVDRESPRVQKKSQRDQRCEAKFDFLGKATNPSSKRDRECFTMLRSVADDDAPVSGHDDVDGVSAARPTKCRNATTEDAAAPSDLRLFTAAGSGDAKGRLGSRAGAGVVQTNRRRYVRNRNRAGAADRLAARGRRMVSGVGGIHQRGRSDKSEGDCRNRSSDTSSSQHGASKV